MEKWSEDEARTAYQLMLEGKSASEVAEIIVANGRDITRNGVIGLVHRYRQKHGLGKIRLSRPKPPPRKKPPKAVIVRPPKVKPVKITYCPEAQEPLWVQLLDLAPYHCRWPVGVGRGIHSTYCGLDRKAESAYCEHHHWRAHNVVTE